jgi:hypothetical protein
MADDRWDIKVTVDSKGAQGVEQQALKAIQALSGPSQQFGPKTEQAILAALRERADAAGRTARATVSVPLYDPARPDAGPIANASRTFAMQSGLREMGGKWQAMGRNESLRDRGRRAGVSLRVDDIIHELNGDDLSPDERHMLTAQAEYFVGHERRKQQQERRTWRERATSTRGGGYVEDALRLQRTLSQFEKRAAAANIDPQTAEIGEAKGTWFIRKMLDDVKDSPTSALAAPLLKRARGLVGEFKQGVTTAERDLAKAKKDADDAEKEEANERTKAAKQRAKLARDTSLIGGVGFAAAFRSVSTGAQGIADSVMRGQFTHLPGQLLHTIGSAMQNVGLARVVANRRAAAAGTLGEAPAAPAGDTTGGAPAGIELKKDAKEDLASASAQHTTSLGGKLADAITAVVTDKKEEKTAAARKASPRAHVFHAWKARQDSAQAAAAARARGDAPSTQAEAQAAADEVHEAPLTQATKATGRDIAKKAGSFWSSAFASRHAVAGPASAQDEVAQLIGSGQAATGGEVSRGMFVLPPGIGGMASAAWGGIKNVAGRVGAAFGAAGGMGMAIGGAGLMVAGKLVTAGLERGYDNSEKADQYMAQAAPFFARRQMEYLRAKGRQYSLDNIGDSEYIDGSPVAGGGDNLTADAARKLVRAFSPVTGGGVEANANKASWALSRLGKHGLGRNEAMQAYGSFIDTTGVTRRTVSKDAELIDFALSNGLPSALAAQMVRMGELAGQGSGSMISMNNALISAGVSGQPRNEVIGSLTQQMLSEEAAGMMPSTYAAGNYTREMLGSGMRYSSLARVRGEASGMQQGNLNTFTQMGKNLLQAHMMVNAFKGTDFFGGVERMASSDPATNMARALDGMSGSSRRLALMGMAPGQSSEFDAAVKAMAQQDMDAAPTTTSTGIFGMGDIFRRAAALTSTDWNRLGKERNISTLESAQAFKSALDDAADKMRAVGDLFVSAGGALSEGLGMTQTWKVE